MDKNFVFLMAGGDLRQIYAAKELAQNHIVYAIGFDSLDSIEGNLRMISTISEMPEKADCLILPLPVSNDGVFINAPFSSEPLKLGALTSVLKPEAVVTGGRLSGKAEMVFSDYYTEDYSEREEFCLLNAVPTAEAAVQIILSNTKCVLQNKKILIAGFGRISKALVKILSGFGADITICARKKSDLCQAEIIGCKAFEINKLNNYSGDFDIILNTVPAMILDKSFLQNTKKDIHIIDLASKPGGTDFEFAALNGIKADHALSLPGKFFPVTAGQIIAKTVENILEERSFQNE